MDEWSSNETSADLRGYLEGFSGCGRVRILVGRRHGASSSLIIFGFSLGNGAGSLGGFDFSSESIQN